jgi:hypothetical protein
MTYASFDQQSNALSEKILPYALIIGATEQRPMGASRTNSKGEGGANLFILQIGSPL